MAQLSPSSGGVEAGDSSGGTGSAARRPLVWTLDWLAVVAALLAVSLWWAGGFRVEVFGARLSVTSWIRPAIFSAVLVLLRHWLQPRPALTTLALAAVRSWWTSPETRATLPIFLATRLGTLIVGLFAVLAVGLPMERSPLSVYGHELLDLPARWDAGWYLGIAVNGYQYDPNWRGQQNIAFFPAYPLLMRYASLLMARQTLWAGVVISLAAFFAALVYLHRLARMSMDEERATLAVALAATYPFAVFYSAPYTEGLFLLGIVAAWYHFRMGHLAQAGAWGLLVGLTRPNGCFLAVPLGLMVLERFWTDRSWRLVPARLAVAAMPGIGMLVYSAYIYYLTGDPFHWARLHAAWGREYTPLNTFVSAELESYLTLGVYGVAATRLPALLNGAGVLFALAMVWPVYRRLGLPGVALILLTVLPPLTHGGLLSMGRITAVLFPCFIALAALVPRRHATAWIAAFAALQAFAAVLFFTWRPLY